MWLGWRAISYRASKKRKKQCREGKKRQNIKSEDGQAEETVEEPEETGSGAKGRVIAVDWALSKERWVRERERLGEVADDVENDVPVDMDDAESDASTGEDSEADSEHERLGIHEEDSEDEGGEENDDGEDSEPPECESDEESPKKPQLPHTDTGNTLFIRNVPFTATEDEIRTLHVSPFCSMQVTYTS